MPLKEYFMPCINVFKYYISNMNSTWSNITAKITTKNYLTLLLLEGLYIFKKEVQKGQDEAHLQFRSHDFNRYIRLYILE